MSGFDHARATAEVGSGDLTATEAAARLVAQLRGSELLGLVDGDRPFWPGALAMLRGYNRVPLVAGAVPRLGVPGLRFTDGPRGVVVGTSTAFPAAIARAATFDVALEEEVGRAIGAEARVQGADLFAGICVNLVRHPAWGRTQESYGEDPVIAGELGAALTRGVRGHVMACVKHLALNSIEESRFVVDVRVDEDVLHEVYLAQFRTVVEAGADAVMAAYNAVNGEWAGQHAHLLTDVLRDEWGFDGFTISDFIWGLRDPVASLQAGLDVEMPFRQQRARTLPRAITEGRLDVATVRTAAHRILATQLRHHATRLPEPGPTVVACAEHRSLARRVAARGTVLLRNEPVDGRPVLPLDPSLTSVAVIGRLATSANLGDDGSSAVRPPSTVSPLEGLLAAWPHGQVTSDDGRDPQGAAGVAAAADVAVVVVGFDAEDEGEAMLALDPDSVQLMGWPLHHRPVARAFAVAFGGLARLLGLDGGQDRRSLSLPAADEALLLAVAAANPRTVAVVVSGTIVLPGPWQAVVPAIVLPWYPGMEGGHALADVLTGAVEPGGRLPIAIPVDARHLPHWDPQARRITYDRWYGQRKLDRDGRLAAYPFGFGLGYTTFALSDLRLVDAPPSVAGTRRSGMADAAVDADVGAVEVQVVVTNRGPRDGGAVLQLYAVTDDPALAERPRRQLLGFARADLAGGEARTVAIRGPLRPLATRDPATRAWSVVPGRYRLEVGLHHGDPDAVTLGLDLSPGGWGDPQPS